MSQIEEVLKYSFENKKLLTQALTHKSFAAERGCVNHNERMEFLGDSVLGLAVSHYVYEADENCMEGDLAKLKSKLVSRSFLAKWADDIKLGDYIYLGQGENAAGGRKRKSILSNAMEAIIGAIYLDGGFGPVKKFIGTYLYSKGLAVNIDDFKSTLQEIVQKKFKFPPKYEVTQTVGPEHNKCFTVSVKVKNTQLGRGKGKNKKEAEQFAAKDALNKIEKDGLKI